MDNYPSTLLLSGGAVAGCVAWYLLRSKEASSRGRVVQIWEDAPGARAAVGGTVASVHEVDVNDQKFSALKQDVIDRVQHGVVPMLGIMVAKHGRVVLSVAAGEAREGQGLTPYTLLRFFSNAKPITQAAALILLEEEKLGLDDLVSSHLPCWDDARVTVFDPKSPGMKVPADRALRIVDLFCHIAGLTYGFSEECPEVSSQYRKQSIELPHKLTRHAEEKLDPCSSLREFATRLNDIPLILQPGTRFSYSTSPDLLGAVIEEVTGQPLDTFVRNRIFEPLKMNDSTFIRSKSVDDRLARLFRSFGNCNFELEEDITPALAQSGGAGLISTAWDYMRFVECITNGGELEGVRILQTATLAMANSDHLARVGAEPLGVTDAWPYHGYGLLGGVVTSPGEPGEYFPGGSMSGYGATGFGGAAGTYAFADREKGLSCVLYTQLQFYHVGAAEVRSYFAKSAYHLFSESKSDSVLSYIVHKWWIPFWEFLRSAVFAPKQIEKRKSVREFSG